MTKAPTPGQTRMAEAKTVAPNLLGIGTQKCSTTWLFKNLVRHPDIFGTEQKELHFFDRVENYSLGRDWYLEQFAEAKDEQYRMEYTPNYMTTPSAYMRYLHFSQDYGLAKKFIVMLRNPIDRAWSHYHHNASFPGREVRDFYDEIVLEHKRRQWLDTEAARWRYIDQGFYAKHLRDWITEFGRDRFIFLIHEEIEADPQTTLENVLDELGLDTGLVEAQEWQEKQGYGELDQDLRKLLHDVYAESNQELEELIGRNLDIWKE